MQSNAHHSFATDHFPVVAGTLTAKHHRFIRDFINLPNFRVDDYFSNDRKVLGRINHIFRGHDIIIEVDAKDQSNDLDPTALPQALGLKFSWPSP